MALLDVVTKGTTDYSCTIRIVDSTDGTPETGVVYNSAGIDLWYRRPGAVHTSITEATQTEAGAHTDGGFVHISDGEYRLDLPDAAVASGVDYVDVGGTVTGMVVIGGRIRLTDLDLDDAVRGGMTALPNANAEAAGGLYTRGTGAGQINQTTNGHVDIDAHYWNGTEITTSLETAADIADAVFDEALSGHVTAGTAGERIGRIPNAAAGGNGGLPTVDANNRIVGIQGTLNTLDALDTAQDTQHAATLTRLGTPAGADIAADLATIVADTNELQTDWADAGRLDTILDARAAQTTVDAIETDTQDIQSRLPAALVGGRMDSDVEAINNNTAAADNLQASALGLVSTTVNDASASTTSFVTALTEATDDHYNGRVIVFTSGDLAGQATDITDYNKAVTVTALTEAPANGVSFVIV